MLVFSIYILYYGSKLLNTHALYKTTPRTSRSQFSGALAISYKFHLRNCENFISIEIGFSEHLSLFKPYGIFPTLERPLLCQTFNSRLFHTLTLELFSNSGPHIFSITSICSPASRLSEVDEETSLTLLKLNSSINCG